MTQQLLEEQEKKENTCRDIAGERDLGWDLYSSLYAPQQKAPDVICKSDRGASSTFTGRQNSVLVTPSLEQCAGESHQTQPSLPDPKEQTPALKIRSLSSLIAVFQNSSVMQEDFEDECARLMDDSNQEFVAFLVQIRQELQGLRQDVAILNHERGLSKHCTCS